MAYFRILPAALLILGCSSEGEHPEELAFKAPTSCEVFDETNASSLAASNEDFEDWLRGLTGDGVWHLRYSAGLTGQCFATLSGENGNHRWTSRLEAKGPTLVLTQEDLDAPSHAALRRREALRQAYENIARKTRLKPLPMRKSGGNSDETFLYSEIRDLTVFFRMELCGTSEAYDVGSDDTLETCRLGYRYFAGGLAVASTLTKWWYTPTNAQQENARIIQDPRVVQRIGILQHLRCALYAAAESATEASELKTLEYLRQEIAEALFSRYEREDVHEYYAKFESLPLPPAEQCGFQGPIVRAEISCASPFAVSRYLP